MKFARMTKQLFDRRTKTVSVRKSAWKIDRCVDVEHMDGGIIVYHFTDGSKLLSRGRARSHQVWIGSDA